MTHGIGCWCVIWLLRGSEVKTDFTKKKPVMSRLFWPICTRETQRHTLSLSRCIILFVWLFLHRCLICISNYFSLLCRNCHVGYGSSLIKHWSISRRFVYDMVASTSQTSSNRLALFSSNFFLYIGLFHSRSSLSLLSVLNICYIKSKFCCIKLLKAVTYLRNTLKNNVKYCYKFPLKVIVCCAVVNCNITDPQFMQWWPSQQTVEERGRPLPITCLCVPTFKLTRQAIFHLN